MEVDHEDPVTGASQALEVAAGDIIGKLKITKAKPPKLWPSADLSKSFLNVTAEEEHRKASIYLLLWEAYHNKDTDENFIKVVQQPGKGFSMYAACGIPQHQLILMPFTDQVSKLFFVQPKGKEFGQGSFKKMKFFILPPKAMKEGDHGPEGSFCPFFHCKAGSSTGNMEPTTIKYKDLQIDGLHNLRPLAQNEEISVVASVTELKVVEASSSKKRKKAWQWSLEAESSAWKKVANMCNTDEKALKKHISSGVHFL